MGASAFRFLDKGVNPEQMQALYDKIVKGESVNLEEFRRQVELAL